MKPWTVVSAAAVGLAAGPAVAQGFNQAIVFGDSNVDSGFYQALPSPQGGSKFNALWASAVAHGAGAPTSSPGLMNSQVLAAYFGLTALPANQGGTNYATSGAKDVTVNNGQTGGFGAAIPTVTQIANYLAANGGRANGNALYLINSGSNDVSFALGSSGTGPFPANPTQYLIDSANGLAAAVGRLQAAGARYFIVPDEPYSFPVGSGAAAARTRQFQLLMSQDTWSALSAAGVSFIPADINAVRLAIAADRTAFGFEFIDTALGHTACTRPAGVTTAWALLCSSAPGAPSTFATPNADQTRLFADDQHLSTAGQKILGDYYYSLIVAPSEISFLAEDAVQIRFGVVQGIQQQIDISQRQRGPGINIWLNGDLSHLSIRNGNPGFPTDPDTPVSGTAGMDYRWLNGLLVGAAVTVGSQTPAFSLGGDFRQNEVAGSVYAAYRAGPLWGDVIATYGALDFDVNRIVPVGITLQGNTASTRGSNSSLALEAGYDQALDRLTHGPVAGITLQQVKIGGFTETGSFTSLSFGDQTRDSAVTALGYRASYDAGQFRPFALVVWNHELASPDRLVTASLTTVAAPSYAMPAVLVGRDWATGTVGTTLNITKDFTGLASFTAQVGHTGVTSYGGRIGLNYAFTWDRPVVTKY